MAFLAGSALATSGMAFQAMFRNPLATPFTLGVSSGASLGAALAIQCGWSVSAWGISSISLAAFLGAVASIVLVYAMTAGLPPGLFHGHDAAGGRGREFLLFQPDTACAIHERLYPVVPHVALGDGGLESIVSFHDVLGVFPFVAAGCLIVWYLTLELNLLSDRRGFRLQPRRERRADQAFAVLGGLAYGRRGGGGVRADRIRGADGAAHLPPAGGLRTSGVVSGGLAVWRRFFGALRHGGEDVMAPTELPVGILTALLGGPFFLWLLLTRRRDFLDL